MLSKNMKKRGQVWIETVTYTLIAFVLIGLVLGFAKPKIEEIQDQAIIEQTAQIMREIDSIIQEISEKGEGNKRKIEVTLRKGQVTINGINDSIEFFIEGKHMYSQPNQSFEEGNIEIITQEVGKIYTVSMVREYKNFDIQYTDKDEAKKILRGSTPYNIYITNKGGVNNTINFEIN